LLKHEQNSKRNILILQDIERVRTAEKRGEWEGKTQNMCACVSEREKETKALKGKRMDERESTIAVPAAPSQGALHTIPISVFHHRGTGVGWGRGDRSSLAEGV
jgi:hypothetical protein